ncbi:MAG: NUDIX domain-containing protein [Notoacmeibacter sp.]
MRAFLLRLRNHIFHTLFLLQRPMTLGARVMLFNDRGEICLIKHGYVAGWQLPGGGVDAGETIETAAVRELAEEAGFKPTGPISLFAVYKNEKASKRDHVLLYVCRLAAPIAGFKIDGREIIDCRFFAADALPQDVTGSTKRRVAEVVTKAPVDSFW